VRRSPLEGELARAADKGTADAVAVASRRCPRVRATKLPGDEFVDVPEIDARTIAFARALDEIFNDTPGGIMFEHARGT
jgi:hypothetical protein